MTQHYSLTDLARQFSLSASGVLKKLSAAGVNPVFSREANGRSYRYYDASAEAVMQEWRKQLDARQKLIKLKKEASKQRKLVREIKAATAAAAEARVIPDAAPDEMSRTISQLADKVDLLVTAINVLSRRVDSMLDLHTPRASIEDWKRQFGGAQFGGVQPLRQTGLGPTLQYPPITSADFSNEALSRADEPELAAR